MAVWLVIAVMSSTVMTCVPRAMQRRASQMPACAGMTSEDPCASSNSLTTCCTHHDPSLTVAKADVLKSPLHEMTTWPTGPATIGLLSTVPSVVSGESPPELISTLGPPSYIALSALRV
jgi:hypothetical protein